MHDLRSGEPGAVQVSFLLEPPVEYCAKVPAGRSKARLTFDMSLEYVKGNPDDSLTRERAALAVGGQGRGGRNAISNARSSWHSNHALARRSPRGTPSVCAEGDHACHRPLRVGPLVRARRADVS